MNDMQRNNGTLLFSHVITDVDVMYLVGGGGGVVEGTPGPLPVDVATPGSIKSLATHV